MDAELIKFLNRFVEINKNILKSGSSFMPVCAIIRDDNKVEIVAMPFRTSKEKEITREILKKHILEKKTKGYIIAMDTKMTIMSQVDKDKTEVKDALVHSLFTPKSSLNKINVYIQDGKKITFAEEFEYDNFNSVWNIWNLMDDDEKTNAEYYKFKDANPDKYKETL